MVSYEVLSPTGSPAKSERVVRRGRSGLAGTVAFLWHYGYRGDDIFRAIELEFTRVHPDTNFVPFDVFGNIHGPDEHKVLADLPEVLDANHVEAVVAGVGA